MEMGERPIVRRVTSARALRSIVCAISGLIRERPSNCCAGDIRHEPAALNADGLFLSAETVAAELCSFVPFVATGVTRTAALLCWGLSASCSRLECLDSFAMVITPE